MTLFWGDIIQRFVNWSLKYPMEKNESQFHLWYYLLYFLQKGAGGRGLRSGLAPGSAQGM